MARPHVRPATVVIASGRVHPSGAFSCFVREAEDDNWSRVLDVFQDSNVFQTTAFCRAKTPGARLEQLILRRGEDAIAAALVRVAPIPFVGASIAYVLWGPLFHRWKCDRDPTALAHALKALRHEYVVKRGLGLRIAPFLTRADGIEWSSLFQEQGYRRIEPHVSRRTILVELDRSLEQLRRGLDQKWRNCLNRAERGNLEIREGADASLFEPFLEVYREMLARKGLGEPGDIRSFMAAQTALPERFKLRIFVALEAGRPSAGTICSAIARRGVYLFGATGTSGMSNKASYLLQWRMMQWLKEQGCRVYDLHGTNAEGNPGVYSFKRGLCGKNGREVEMAGHFEAWEGARMRVVLTTADRANESYKKLRALYGRLRGFRG